MAVFKLNLVILCCCAISFAHAQIKPYNHIDTMLQSGTGKDFFSGDVLVADHGKVVYHKAAGFRDFEKMDPLRAGDVFELASVSKQFTAMVIMMLQEKGLLTFDDPVEKYISIPYKSITIRNLLTHTSGLPDYMATMETHWDKSKVAGNEDIIALLNTYAPPKLFEPGAKYLYSNTGFVLLASIAEKASGRDFVEFCTNEIFRKLGMTHTAIRTAEEKNRMARFAPGHIYVPAKNAFVRADSFPLFNYTLWLGNRKGPGRISSTADDLLIWDQALYENKLVRAETLEQAFKPMTLNNGTVSNYGFGWVIVPGSPAGRIVWHNGDNPGYKTLIMRLLDLHKTIIVLSNNAATQLERIVRQIRDLAASNP